MIDSTIKKFGYLEHPLTMKIFFAFFHSLQEMPMFLPCDSYTQRCFWSTVSSVCVSVSSWSGVFSIISWFLNSTNVLIKVLSNDSKSSPPEKFVLLHCKIKRNIRCNWTVHLTMYLKLCYSSQSFIKCWIYRKKIYWRGLFCQNPLIHDLGVFGSQLKPWSSCWKSATVFHSLFLRKLFHGYLSLSYTIQYMG